MKKYRRNILVILITVMLTFVTAVGNIGTKVNAASKYKLSSKSVSIENGKTYKIKLKGVSGKINTKKLKWKSSKKSVASVTKLSSNKALIKAKNPGQTMVTATYKGKKYKCLIKVNKKTVPDEPKLNATEVEIHRISDKAIPYIGKNSSKNYSFQFKVTGTRYSVLEWSIEGGKREKQQFIVTDDGVVKMHIGNEYTKPSSECIVRAKLSNGKELTAKVIGIDDEAAYIRKVMDDFKKTYITDSMTEYQKMEKVAWYLSAEYDYQLYQPSWGEYIITGKGDCFASRVAVMYFCRDLGLHAGYCPDYDAHGDTVVRADGKVYLVTTGFNEKKPRTYWINEMTRELFDKRNPKNFLDPEYFWGE